MCHCLVGVGTSHRLWHLAKKCSLSNTRRQPSLFRKRKAVFNQEFFTFFLSVRFSFFLLCIVSASFFGHILSTQFVCMAQYNSVIL